MNEVRQLSPSEVVFIGGELPSFYQHTGGLTVLEPVDGVELSYERFRAQVEERLGAIPQFRWRLHEVPFGLDLPYWVEDEDFSFDRHIRRVAVPAPGDRNAVAELVAYLYSRRLERNHPLWEIWFLEGLEGGQSALFAKLHHSLMDGEGAEKLGASICDLEPNAPPREIDPALTEAQPAEAPEWWRQSMDTAWHLSSIPVRAGRELFGGLRRAWDRQVNDGSVVTPRPKVPVTTFNCSIGTDRGFVFGTVPLADVKRVKDHFDVTVNDVVLALVGSSLRGYLDRRGELPEDSLRTSIGVSLRSDGDISMTNQVTTAGVTLATAVDDPVERLRLIAAETAEAKQAARAGTTGFLELMGIFPPSVVTALMSVTPPTLAVKTTGFNLIISNVRGSPFPLYVAGARIAAMYPMSILGPGCGLNVTCISHVDDLDFGLTIEPAAFGEPWELIDGIEAALTTYLSLLAPTRSSARSKRQRSSSKTSRT